MPPLKEEDVQTWGKSKVETEMRKRLEEVESIRQKAGGTLAEVADGDADNVRTLNTDLNVLGERIDAIAELQKADDHAVSLKEYLDTPASRLRHGGVKGTVDGLEIDTRDAGTIFSESSALKEYREHGRKGIESEVPISSILPQLRSLDVKGFQPAGRKDVLGEATNTDVATAYPVQSMRVGVLVEELFQQPNVADLMPQTTISQPAVPYMREIINNTGAVETAEGALAPEASLEFVEDSAPVRKVTVTIPVTEEILEDEQLVRGHINNRLPQFVQWREDSQLLRGDGTGQNLLGILNLSGIDATTAYSIGTPSTPGGKAQDILDSVFHASMRVAESFLLADATVMSIGLWEQIRLAKDKNGQYLIAPATEGFTPRVFGLRTVINQNMPIESAGNFPILVGAFATASQIWRRRSITLAVSDSHTDRFARGILTIKATSRLAVTHYRPAGYALVESNA
jgi:HK97 family phage major capsid protein